MRIIPRWKAIKDIPGVMPCEDLREILKEAEAAGTKLNATRCPCRTTSRSENCPVDEGVVPWEGNCVHFGAFAKYYSEVLKATPYLTAAHIQANLDRQEKVPFYHMVPNFRVVGALCNCSDITEACGIA